MKHPILSVMLRLVYGAEPRVPATRVVRGSSIPVRHAARRAGAVAVSAVLAEPGHELRPVARYARPVR
jgi:hypothetical protein